MRMKTNWNFKWFPMMLAAVFCLIFMVSCGESGEYQSETASDQNQNGYVLTVEGTQLFMHAEAQPILAVLGEPVSAERSPSCAFEGEDVLYTYSHLRIQTYPKDGKEYLLTVYLTDDTYTTAEGIRVGDEESKVLTVYGEPSEKTESAKIYVAGKTKLQFLFRNGCVSGIQYLAVTD